MGGNPMELIIVAPAQRKGKAMNGQALERYLKLTERRTEILLLSGGGWKPEYGKELELIDQELEELRQQADKGQQVKSGKIPTMFTLPQASRATGVSRDCIKNLCLQNKIAYIMSGSRYLINMEKLTAYLNGEE